MKEKDQWNITKVGYSPQNTTDGQVIYTTTGGTTNNIYTTDHVVNTNNIFWTDDKAYSTTTYYDLLKEQWPIVDNAIGIIYVDDDKIKIKTKSGEDIVIADISEGQSEVVVNLLAVIAKKKLEESQSTEE